MIHELSRQYSHEKLQSMATAILHALPSAFQRHIVNVKIDVKPLISDDELSNVDPGGESTAYDFIGLYTGSLHSDAATISIFRDALFLESVETEETVEDLLRHTVIRNLGPHFGLSPAEMDKIEQTGLADHAEASRQREQAERQERHRQREGAHRAEHSFESPGPHDARDTEFHVQNVDHLLSPVTADNAIDWFNKYAIRAAVAESPGDRTYYLTGTRAIYDRYLHNMSSYADLLKAAQARTRS